MELVLGYHCNECFGAWSGICPFRCLRVCSVISRGEGLNSDQGRHPAGPSGPRGGQLCLAPRCLNPRTDTDVPITSTPPPNESTHPATLPVSPPSGGGGQCFCTLHNCAQLFKFCTAIFEKSVKNNYVWLQEEFFSFVRIFTNFFILNIDILQGFPKTSAASR